MKAITKIVIIMVFLMYLMTAPACIVLKQHDNGKHKGWSKNQNKHGHQKSQNNGNLKGNTTVLILD